MDLATIIGIIMGFGLVIGSIMVGGSLGAFFNIPGLVIVVGGTFAATLISEKLSVFIGAAKVALKAFISKPVFVDKTINRLVELATLMRKDGALALENEEIDDQFLAKGVRMSVDGLAPEEVHGALMSEMRALKERHRQGHRIFRFMGATAPAMGMVGTLIGLVQMLQSMESPDTIGPSMAVALLTTLYGAVLAFLVFLPIADKLECRTKDEARNMAVVVMGVDSLLKGENPRFMRDKLDSFLDPRERNREAEKTEESE